LRPHTLKASSEHAATACSVAGTLRPHTLKALVAGTLRPHTLKASSEHAATACSASLGKGSELESKRGCERCGDGGERSEER
jgi:hypothetical protein